MTSDYYPSIRTIVAIFYFAYWFFKGAKPFSIWWLILIYVIDYIIAIIILNITTSMMRRQ
jgi:hypothetical protein